MTITQNQSGQLVAKETRLRAYIIGALLIVISIVIMPLGILTIIIGLAVIILKKNIYFVIDQTTRTINYKAGNLISKESKVINFSEIQSVKLVSQKLDGRTNQRRHFEYLIANLQLVLNDGQVVTLTTKNSKSTNEYNSANNSPVPAADIGKQIADFIGVPLAAEGPGVLKVPT